MDSDLLTLANLIYGEAADQDSEVMTMVGSTAMNRLSAERAEEFGSTLEEVGQKGYYAVSNPNVPYRQALSGEFPDKTSETAYKQAMSIASGLLRGTIEPVRGHFYYKKDEIKNLKKRGKRAFDFKKVKEVGQTGDYTVYSY